VTGYQQSRRYGFVRARQLEGTFPGDKRTGTWPITMLRVHYGWGAPPEESWPYKSGWPPVEPPGIDLVAKQYRSGPYRRVRTIAECRRSLISEGPLGVSLDITDKWANPPEGRIPAPSVRDIHLTTHYVMLAGYDAARDEFKFINSWGTRWGDRGCGYITGQALEATWWEAWKNIHSSLPRRPLMSPRPHLTTSTFEAPDGSTLHWLEVIGQDDERLAWASAVEDGANLEVEELFVRPAYRNLGYGRKLMRSVHEMAEARRLSFRLWVSFADTAPLHLFLIKSLAEKVGLSIQPSGVRWAPFVVAPARDQETEPVPTFPYPEKPPSSPRELISLAGEVLMALGTGVVANAIYDAIRSWFDPKGGKRIRAKLGDRVLETSEVSPDEFVKLLKELQHAKDEAEFKSRILEAGITIRIIEQ
jgi:GNAT superfamily N-acetyltransferase